jgi:hypothetical protein
VDRMGATGAAIIVAVKRTSKAIETTDEPSAAEPQPNCHAARLNAEDAEVFAKAAKKIRLRVPLRQPLRPLR